MRQDLGKFCSMSWTSEPHRIIHQIQNTRIFHLLLLCLLFFFEQLKIPPSLSFFLLSSSLPSLSLTSSLFSSPFLFLHPCLLPLPLYVFLITHITTYLMVTTTAHCTSRFKRVMLISCWQHVDVHMELTLHSPIHLPPPDPDPSVWTLLEVQGKVAVTTCSCSNNIYLRFYTYP